MKDAKFMKNDLRECINRIYQAVDESSVGPIKLNAYGPDGFQQMSIIAVETFKMVLNAVVPKSAVAFVQDTKLTVTQKEARESWQEEGDEP